MIANYIEQVITDIHATAHEYSKFIRLNVVTHPIPFLGDIEKASLLTVGVNPSAGEFVNREWPVRLSAGDLSARLQQYFVSAPVPQHPWFATWIAALAQLGVSYSHDAAHIDLSPRATVAMGSIPDWQGFANMVERDARWFFRLLSLCRGLRTILLAGCVTKKWYMCDFVQRIAPKYGYELTGNVEKSGEGRVGFMRLHGPVGNIPVFFCSVSPSGRKRHILIDRVRANAETIRDWL